MEHSVCPVFLTAAVWHYAGDFCVVFLSVWVAWLILINQRSLRSWGLTSEYLYELWNECNSLISVFLLTGSVELIKSCFESWFIAVLLLLFLTCIDAIFRVTVDRSNILVENFALVLLAQSEIMLDLVVAEPTGQISRFPPPTNANLLKSEHLMDPKV